jgi:hypothetical protein
LALAKAIFIAFMAFLSFIILQMVFEQTDRAHSVGIAVSIFVPFQHFIIGFIVLEYR